MHHSRTPTHSVQVPMKLLSRPRPMRFRDVSHNPLRDVVGALALKGVLLLAIYLLFFGPSDRRPANADATAGALLGTPRTEVPL